MEVKFADALLVDSAEAGTDIKLAYIFICSDRSVSFECVGQNEIVLIIILYVHLIFS